MKFLEELPAGFEELDSTRSDFVRALILYILEHPPESSTTTSDQKTYVPKTLVRYWHDPNDVPMDVAACLSTWDRLRDEGFNLLMFDDGSAAAYIESNYGPEHLRALARCPHNAMRSDEVRLCFVLAQGGVYVDTDDALLMGRWKSALLNETLKLQPLCYDTPSGSMVSTNDIWRPDLSTDGRIFYVNNNPLIAPPDHPILRRALTRSTTKLLGSDPRPEIQSTTGPGNLTAALVAHAYELLTEGKPLDFQLFRNWEAIAETRWELGYRNDARNWRNIG